MKETKVRFSLADLARLDREAAAAGTTRSDLVRQRALVTNACAALSTLSPADYHALVATAAAEVHGLVPRAQVEYLVAYVITRLDQHARQAGTGHQSVR